MGLNYFNASLLERFANEHLKDRFDLQIEIKQVWIDILHLDCLVSAFFIWDVHSTWWSIDVVVRLNLRLIDHPVAIIQFSPVVHDGWGGHLHVRLIHVLHVRLLATHVCGLRVLTCSIVHHLAFLGLHGLSSCHSLFLLLHNHTFVSKESVTKTLFFYSQDSFLLF